MLNHNMLLEYWLHEQQVSACHLIDVNCTTIELALRRLMRHITVSNSEN